MLAAPIALALSSLGGPHFDLTGANSIIPIGIRWWADAFAASACGTRSVHSDQSGFAKSDRIDLSARGKREKFVSKACLNGGSSLDFGQRPDGLVQSASQDREMADGPCPQCHICHGAYSLYNVRFKQRTTHYCISSQSMTCVKPILFPPIFAPCAALPFCQFIGEQFLKNLPLLLVRRLCEAFLVVSYVLFADKFLDRFG